MYGYWCTHQLSWSFQKSNVIRWFLKSGEPLTVIFQWRHKDNREIREKYNSADLKDWENLVKECQLPLEKSEHMEIGSSLELSENEYSPVNVILA